MWRILIVDEDGALRSRLVAAFEARGITADESPEGWDAIDRLQAWRYEAIVMDLVLPRGLNGFAIMNFLESERSDLIDCVFIMSGMSRETVALTMPRVLPRYFPKPLDENALVEAVAAKVKGAEY